MSPAATSPRLGPWVIGRSDRVSPARPRVYWSSICPRRATLAIMSPTPRTSAAYELSRVVRRLPRRIVPGGRAGPQTRHSRYTARRGQPTLLASASIRTPQWRLRIATRLTPSTWSTDGRRLTFYEFPSNRIAEVTVPADGTSLPQPRFMNFSGATHDVSADGQWLTYADAGINVRPLPAGERVQKVSDTGSEPKWCRCNEIIYRNGTDVSVWRCDRVRRSTGVQPRDPADPVQRSPGTSFVCSRRPADPQREQKRRGPGHDSAGFRWCETRNTGTCPISGTAHGTWGSLARSLAHFGEKVLECLRLHRTHRLL